MERKAEVNQPAHANERLEGFEAGIDLEPASGVKVALTAFDNRVKAAIANVTIGPNLRERRNVDAVHARGIEFAGTARLGAFDLDLTFATIDSQVEGSGASAALDGKRPAQVPKFSAGATLGWRPSKGVLLSATLRHVGAQFEDDLETDVLPAVTMLSAVATMPVTGKLSVVLRGENLTDAKVITRNQAGSIDLGAPRAIWVGIRLGF